MTLLGWLTYGLAAVLLSWLGVLGVEGLLARAKARGGGRVPKWVPTQDGPQAWGDACVWKLGGDPWGLALFVGHSTEHGGWMWASTLRRGHDVEGPFESEEEARRDAVATAYLYLGPSPDDTERARRALKAAFGDGEFEPRTPWEML